MQILNVGVLGCGSQCVSRHLPALSEIPWLRVSALYDKNPDRIAAAHEALNATASRKSREAIVTHGDLDSFLRDCDVVDIVVPPSEHYDVIRRCVELRKPFIIEKPLGRTWHEAAELVELCRRTGVSAGYLENQLFHPLVRATKRRMVDGSFGRAQWISVDLPNPGPSPHIGDAEWRYDPVVAGGGAVIDWGTHLIAISLYLASERFHLASTRCAQMSSLADYHLVSGALQQLQVEDLASFELSLRSSEDDPVVVDIRASWRDDDAFAPDARHTVLRVAGEGGVMCGTVLNAPGARRCLFDTELRGVRRNVEMPAYSGVETMRQALSSALQAVKSAKHPTHWTTLDLAVDVQFCVASVYLSHRYRRRVSREEVGRELLAGRSSGKRSGRDAADAFLRLLHGDGRSIV